MNPSEPAADASRSSKAALVTRSVLAAVPPLASIVMVWSVDETVRAWTDGYGDFALLPAAQSVVLGTLVCTAVFFLAFGIARAGWMPSWGRYIIAAVFGLLAFGCWIVFFTLVESQTHVWESGCDREREMLSCSAALVSDAEAPAPARRPPAADHSIHRRSPGSPLSDVPGELDGRRTRMFLIPFFVPREFADVVQVEIDDKGYADNEAEAIEQATSDLAGILVDRRHAWRVQTTRGLLSLMQLLIACIACVALAMLTSPAGHLVVELVDKVMRELTGGRNSADAQAGRDGALAEVERKPDVMAAPREATATVADAESPTVTETGGSVGAAGDVTIPGLADGQRIQGDTSPDSGGRA